MLMIFPPSATFLAASFRMKKAALELILCLVNTNFRVSQVIGKRHTQTSSRTPPR